MNTAWGIAHAGWLFAQLLRRQQGQRCRLSVLFITQACLFSCVLCVLRVCFCFKVVFLLLHVRPPAISKTVFCRAGGDEDSWALATQVLARVGRQVLR